METKSTPTPQSGPRGWEFTAAFLALRLFLGLRALMAGIAKFESGGVYSLANYGKNMGHMAEGITSASFLPLWMTKLFAGSLGYLLIALGAALLLGIKIRVSLAAMVVTYIALGFGLMAVQEDQGTAWIGIYTGLTVAALVLARHDRFSVWSDRHE